MRITARYRLSGIRHIRFYLVRAHSISPTLTYRGTVMFRYEKEIWSVLREDYIYIPVTRYGALLGLAMGMPVRVIYVGAL